MNKTGLVNNNFKTEFQKFLDSAPDAMVIVNGSGNIVFINTQAEKLFGYAPEELLNQKVEILMPLEYQKKHVGHRDDFIKDLRARPMGAGFELFGAHKNGTKFPVEISLSPIHTDNGVLVSSAIRDITERKKIEIDLIQLNNNLKEINKELESFSYSISHDLRAPLRHIIGFSNKLSKLLGDRMDAESNRVLNKISGSASNMSMLMDELLKFIRIGRTELSIIRFNSQDLVLNIIEQLSASLDSRKVKWEVEYLPVINADKSLLNTVFYNLLANSLKFSNMREVTAIGINCIENEEEFIFSVKDNGAGFDNIFKDNLFGVFKRLHTPEEFEGIGIGLAFVKRIIQKHGGRVWANGETDKGAEFYFTLPKDKKGDLWKI